MTAPTPAGKAAEILDAAETRMRRGGYDAVSFRDLAQEVGIKSASVHYHFPQKTDLGEALVTRYADRVLGALGAPDDPAEDVPARLARLCDVYRKAAVEQDLICLCCVLGSQALDLPPPVAGAVERFFERVLLWAGRALEGSRLDPADTVSSIQGAMILAIALRRPELFERTVSRLQASV